MNQEQNQGSIKQSLLEKIKKGEFKMLPRSRFILKAVLIITGIIIVFGAALYIISFMLFIFRKSPLQFLPEFGFGGLRMLFGVFPWTLIIIALVFIVILEILVKRYSFAYRNPLLYSALAVIILVLVVGFIIGQTPLHRRMFQEVRAGRLSFARPFYRNLDLRKPENVFHGTVLETSENSFTLETPEGKVLTVEIVPETMFPREKEVKKGDYVMVIGKIKENIIEAGGIRKLPKDFPKDLEFEYRPGFPPRPMMF
jgi:glucan phosphoethanolaminetransferase (alkaline phosphatase superfamily)